MSVAYMKSDQAGVRILKHIRDYGASSMYDIINCNDPDCCDGDMTYSRFTNGRSYIGHIYLWAHDEPFIARYDAGRGTWVYDLPDHWNEAMLYQLWLLKHLATRADGFAASAKATNGKFATDPGINAGIKAIFALLQHQGVALKSSIDFIKQQIATIV